MSEMQRFYWTPDLMKIAGRSRQWVTDGIRNKTLPTPVRVGKRNGWPKPVIDKLFGLDVVPVAGTSEAGK